MHRAAARLVLAILLVACADGEAPKALSESGETVYPVRGTILSRSESANTLHMDHEEIPGFMPAMKMDYAVRGSKVAELPPDGKRVEAKLHVTQQAYWITDVKPIP